MTTFKRVLGGVVAVAVLAVGFIVLRPKDSGHHYSAVLADASELVRNNGVRLKDVQVGKVTSIKVDGLHAKVGFTVAKDVHLPAQTNAVVRQTSMLGEMFIDLEPQGDGVLKDGTTIPLSRTRRAAQLEQVVSLGGQLVNQVTADNFNRMITTFDDAWGGHPERLQHLFDAMSGASNALDSNREALGQTIDKVEQVAASLSPNTSQLAQSVNEFAAGLKALDAHRDELGNFTTSLSHLSDSASDLLVKHEAQLAASGKQTKDVLDQIVSNLDDFMKGLDALPDFNLGWQCTVQGNWIQELQPVYPEVARVDTGGGHCAPDQGPRGRQEQGQVQVTGTPTMPGINDPAHTGDVNLGAGSANENSGRGPSSADDGGLSAFMMTTASGGR
ncbi:MAG: MCE family protein [Acidimicrobiia bacterium]|nr:MCE family protein [Acidimicrobiia bacterium]